MIPRQLEHSEANGMVRPEVRALLDPELWRPVLEEYAHAVEIAVALIDVHGQRLGEWINPQPLWTLLQANGQSEEDVLPGPLSAEQSAASTETVFGSDRLGFVHFAVPLSVEGVQVGFLVGGQVQGQFPDRCRLELEHTAVRLQLPPQQVWQLASRMRPISQKALSTCARLLATLGNSFVATQYNAMSEAERLAELSGLHEQLQFTNRKVTDILESIGDAFVSVDQAWRVVYANRHTLRSIGALHTQVQGQSFWEVFAHLVGTEAEEHYRRAMDERTAQQFEVFDPTSLQWSEVSTYPSADGLSIYGRDINERKRTEAALCQAKREAELANRAKDEFLASLSHELRTPLNPIIGWTQILKRGGIAADKQVQALDIIERNAKAQLKLTEDLLDVTRIIRGELRLHKRPLEPGTIVEAAVEALRPAAAAKNIGLTCALDQSAGQVLGDSDRLQQVLWNLLSNAIKFTLQGGRVETHVSGASTHVEIRVSDTGCGIEAEFLPFVFERFRQADGSSRRSHNGLGLGLSIVRELVALHDGTVHVHSDGSGKGATFTVHLPLLK